MLGRKLLKGRSKLQCIKVKCDSNESIGDELLEDDEFTDDALEQIIINTI